MASEIPVMRIWNDYTALELVKTAGNAGWIMVMIAICLATFTVSSAVVQIGPHSRK
jgi:hypothetical protein